MSVSYAATLPAFAPDDDREPATVEDFVRDYVRPGRPVVFRGGVKQWPAVSLWSPEYLASYVAYSGDIEVACRRRSATPASADAPPPPWIWARTSLRGMLEECAGAAGEDEAEVYVPGLDVSENDTLSVDLARPEMLPPGKHSRVTIFFGRNTQCNGHYHPRVQAFLCQVQGKKRVWMYPPSEVGKLYMHPVWRRRYYASQVDFYGDRSRYPRVERAKAQLFELNPGDVLFIPMHWLHVPEGRGWSVSVTHWWKPDLMEWPVNALTVRTLVGLALRAVRKALERKRPAESPEEA